MAVTPRRRMHLSPGRGSLMGLVMTTALATPPSSRLSPPPELTLDEAREIAAGLPLSSRFTLGPEITPVQRAFLDQHGFILFSRVVAPSEIAQIDREVRAIQERWLAEGRTKVYGIPLWVGRDPEGAPFIQRFAFTSMFSEYLREFVRDARFTPVRGLIAGDTRVGDQEKDGVVFNRNMNVPGSAYPKLGWHTDGLRDLFYMKLPGPMLNVGLHLDRVGKDDGGLRVIPGSHRQGFGSMCFRKPYFVWHRPDPQEVAIETQPGDLTVHDGRTWHRVAASPHEGWRSLRRTMYVPYLSGPYQPKDESSRMPAYHHLGRFMRWLKRLA